MFKLYMIIIAFAGGMDGGVTIHVEHLKTYSSTGHEFCIKRAKQDVKQVNLRKRAPTMIFYTCERTE